jgi:ClpP class serine protease
MVDRAHQQFVGDVARGRGVTPAVVERDYGQGRMLDAQAAKAAGMVDAIEPLVKAVQRVMRLKPGTAPAPARLRADTPTPALQAQGDFRLRRHQQRLRQARLMEMRA